MQLSQHTWRQQRIQPIRRGTYSKLLTVNCQSCFYCGGTPLCRHRRHKTARQPSHQNSEWYYQRARIRRSPNFLGWLTGKQRIQRLHHFGDVVFQQVVKGDAGHAHPTVAQQIHHLAHRAGLAGKHRRRVAQAVRVCRQTPGSPVSTTPPTVTRSSRPKYPARSAVEPVLVRCRMQRNDDYAIERYA